MTDVANPGVGQFTDPKNVQALRALQGQLSVLEGQFTCEDKGRLSPLRYCVGMMASNGAEFDSHCQSNLQWIGASFFSASKRWVKLASVNTSLRGWTP